MFVGPVVRIHITRTGFQTGGRSRVPRGCQALDLQFGGKRLARSVSYCAGEHLGDGGVQAEAVERHLPAPPRGVLPELDTGPGGTALGRRVVVGAQRQDTFFTGQHDEDAVLLHRPLPGNGAQVQPHRDVRIRVVDGEQQFSDQFGMSGQSVTMKSAFGP